MSEQKHTPTPWHLDGEDIFTSDNELLVTAYPMDFGGDGTALANAAFIVRAVNSHEQLVAALRDCVSVMDRDLNGLAVIQPELAAARAALAVAGAA